MLVPKRILKHNKRKIKSNKREFVHHEIERTAQSKTEWPRYEQNLLNCYTSLLAK